jgi:hypothetical protein
VLPLPLPLLKPEHKPRWNPELQEWFCATCGRTSDYTLEADAQAELNAFDCVLVGIQKKEKSALERKKTALMEKIQKKF